MRGLSIITCGICVLTLSGCDRVENAMFDYTGLDKVSQLEARVAKAESHLAKLELDNLLEVIDRKTYETCVLDPYVSGFSRVDSASGIFFLAITDIVPHLAGYKITLAIGNPLAVEYEECTVTVTYRSEPGRDQEDADRVSEKQVALTMDKPLRAGTWNNAELVISPASKQEIRRLECSLETGKINLKVAE